MSPIDTAIARVNASEVRVITPLSDAHLIAAANVSGLPATNHYDLEFRSVLGEISQSFGYYGGQDEPLKAFVTLYKWSEIELIAVLPRFRGRKYGFALYDFLMDDYGVDMYSIIGANDSFSISGKAFAIAWLNHRKAV